MANNIGAGASRVGAQVLEAGQGSLRAAPTLPTPASPQQAVALEETPTTSYPNFSLRPAIAGMFAGAANIVCGYPFDTVKVRMQEAGRGRYRHALHATRSIVRREGVGALFRGVSVPAVGGALETAVCYQVYRGAIEKLEAGSGRRGGEASLKSIAGASFASGVALSFIISPFELVKVRLQSPSGKNLTTLGVIRQIIRTEGMRGMGRGLAGCVLREGPGTVIFFATYELMRQQMTRQFNIAQGTAADLGSAIMCGGISGMVFWSCVFPIDMCKTRIQLARPGDKGDVGIFTHMQREISKNGIRGLYNGWGATLGRAFPSNAAQWVVWEIAYHHVLPYFEGQGKN